MPTDSPFNPELIRLLVEQELAKQPSSANVARGDTTTPLDQVLAGFPAASAAGPLSPTAANAIGNVMDAASTLAFLKQGKRQEGNPLHFGAPGSMAGVGSTMALTMPGELLIAHFLRQKVPKLAPLIDSLQGGLGAAHLGAGSLNFEDMQPGTHPAAFEQYRDALARSTAR